MQPVLASNPSLRLYGQNNSSVRQRLIFVTAGTAAGAGHNAITCRVDAEQRLTCARINNGWTRLIQCANDVYIAAPTSVNAACTELTLRGGYLGTYLIMFNGLIVLGNALWTMSEGIGGDR
jgi:hypothetical protein